MANTTTARRDSPIAERLAEEEQAKVAASGTALATTDFGDDAGAGLEGTSLAEQSTPILRMLQAGSPQLKPSNPGYIKGAAQGMILNTALGEVYDGTKGIDLIVAAKHYHYGMWIPRAPDGSGGGFRGMLPWNDPIPQGLVAKHGKFKKLPHVIDGADGMEEDVELVETGQLYVLYAPAGELTIETAQRAVVSFTSTSLPAYNAWVTRNNNWTYLQSSGVHANKMMPAALYSYRWNLTVAPDTKGNFEYFIWRSLALLPAGSKPRDALMRRDDPLFLAAREFYQEYRAGSVVVDQAAAVKGDGDEGPIPF